MQNGRFHSERSEESMRPADAECFAMLSMTRSRIIHLLQARPWHPHG
jgi:hypothetical protein